LPQLAVPAVLIQIYLFCIIHNYFLLFVVSVEPAYAWVTCSPGLDSNGSCRLSCCAEHTNKLIGHVQMIVFM
jgi:hypothetical protein